MADDGVADDGVAVPAPDPAVAVMRLIVELGGLLGTPVRVCLAGDGSRATGVLSGFRLAQDGGAGGVYVTLRDHPGELAVRRIEPAGPVTELPGVSDG